ncbi:prephenate dehydrogenase [Jidongwangia harbinensis]|uniref:prephenate dehydrogenase n=1 Tax=Jidongwangia harbinensis TaxID=2878561 RepID=UPI001CD98665|nr:prephenate dehydrogenase/arogenate dehydrogenase family protein [Jidongwangia harbinensis]MCA2214084.1 prephenate dehydrogenase/arogenate dehydrogenase family protein [Jidongwangia harbinensis]
MTNRAIGRAVGVVGTGLIGGSVLMRLHESGADVVGWDPDPATREFGRSAGLSFAERLSDAVAGRDLVFLCGPLVSLPDALSEVVKHTSDECVVTDVGSTKAAVAAVAEHDRLRRFVPGHPMAGTEHAGLTAASATLFQGAPWVLCPDQPVALPHFRALVATVSTVFEARVVPMPAVWHDDVVALSSHLPHVVAGALAGAVARSSVRDGVLALAAGSFRDGTRVAGAPSRRTADMVTENRAAVLRQVRLLRDSLDGIVDRLERADDPALRQEFEIGRQLRAELLHRRLEPAERRFAADDEAERAFLLDLGRAGGHLTGCEVGPDAVVYRALVPAGVA